MEIPHLESDSDRNAFLAMYFMCKKVMKPEIKSNVLDNAITFIFVVAQSF